jgi:hypothetical protein
MMKTTAHSQLRLLVCAHDRNDLFEQSSEARESTLAFLQSHLPYSMKVYRLATDQDDDNLTTHTEMPQTIPRGFCLSHWISLLFVVD